MYNYTLMGAARELGMDLFAVAGAVARKELEPLPIEEGNRSGLIFSRISLLEYKLKTPSKKCSASEFKMLVRFYAGDEEEMGGLMEAALAGGKEELLFLPEIEEYHHLEKLLEAERYEFLYHRQQEGESLPGLCPKSL